MTTQFYRYWGKAADNVAGFHLLPYHCLDVAAVAECWLDSSVALRRNFATITGLDETQFRVWLLFFIALHDYGKFDLRFQRKAPTAWKAVNAPLSEIPTQLTGLEIKNYRHGAGGLYWFYQDLKDRFSSEEDGFCFDDNDDWQAWCSWLAPVVGHHGAVPDDYKKDDAREFDLSSEVSQFVLEMFKQARLQWLDALAQLFLAPAGLSLDDTPPLLATTEHHQSAATMLAGFCSVSDWLGSPERFVYDARPCSNLAAWYEQRLEIAQQVLGDSGVIGQIKPYRNIEALLDGHSPRQIQCLIENLPNAPGLTLIEASTGSGKTEAALAYAWRLLASGLADSIVFALPTQATANAMLTRLEKIAPLLFVNQTNVILAHGRAKYQQNFIDLQHACRPHTAQGDEEAWVQCGQWLAQSRKRVFLGQVGVCTVDQVLVSVLPVKHKFVRGFGIGRSVLIIDEVHAYDSYMYGLLEAVLEQQRIAGGSAILLSATLPSHQKVQLARAWGCASNSGNAAYPLLSHYSKAQALGFDLAALPSQQPQAMPLQFELINSEQSLPDDTLVQRLLDAVLQGAQVCLVCNLVAVAQQIYAQIQARIKQSELLQEDQCLLFHARFTYADRQEKERATLGLFGKQPCPKNARDKGHLLIATQVVEQSLDLDFDWLVTQLCPVDLLFQRMGRLHRHPRERPGGFAEPLCTVLLPTEEGYGLHELIYGNSRVLWRTAQRLQQAVCEESSRIVFPAAYRDWIEKVYCEDTWQDEPGWVLQSYETYEKERCASQMVARQLIGSSMNELADHDGNVAALTRDGEMSLNVIPFYYDSHGERCLLDGRQLDRLEESERDEALNLNSVAVPKGWGKHDKLPDAENDGPIWLMMCSEDAGQFSTSIGNVSYHYHSNTGLSRIDQPKEKS